MSNGDFKDLVILAGLLARPIRVEEAAEALAVSPQEVLEQARTAEQQGMLTPEGAGYVSVGEAPDVDPPYLAYLAGRLAETLAARGGHGEAGRLFHRAGRQPEAVGSLVAAALSDDDEEAANLALDLDPDLVSIDRQDAGRVHLMLARHARNHGLSDIADDRAADAVRRLEGPELIDALGFAAAIASDLQESQRAETLTALGAGVATTLGRLDKAGSMLTLQGRELARLGFAEEADAAVANGIATLDVHGDRGQRFLGRMNTGWIAFDRGILHEAEVTFDSLADQAADLRQPVTQASQMAYHSRALAMIGRINEAMERAGQARAIAEEQNAHAMGFLVALGEVEGALTFQRAEEAASAVELATGIAREYLEPWLNRTSHYAAKVAILQGDRESALSSLAEARRLTPAGIDGWRVRNLIRVTELELIEGEWPQREAEDLTDEFLQARQYLAAAELLTIRAGREKDPELGLQAAALARQVGAPAHAALAIEAAGAWDDPAVAGPVGELMRRAAAAMPDEWSDGLRAVPAFAHALDSEVEEADPEALNDLLSEVLTSAGLSGDMVLSPAQRRARGLVRRKPRRRKTSWGTRITAVAAVAALGVAVVALVNNSQDENGGVVAAPVSTTSTSTTTTTTTLALEDTPLPTPELGLFGTYEFRGGGGLTGVSEGGVPEPAGRYWVQKPGGFFRADAVAAGRFLYLGSSTNDEVFLVDLNTGVAVETLDAGGRVLVHVAVGDLKPARGDQSVKTAIYVSEGGLVQGQSVEGASSWSQTIDGGVSAGPVVAGNLAVISTEGGRVYGFNSDGIEWMTPAEEEEPFAAISEEAAYAGGVLHVADARGDLHLIDAETGVFLCTRSFGQPPIGNPVVSDGTVYLQAVATLVYAPAGTCDGTPNQIVMDAGVNNAIAVNDGIVFSAESNRLFPFDPARFTTEIIGSGEQLGPWAPFITESDITTPPVIADGLVLIGTQQGMVHAIDLATGAEAWRFDAGIATDDIVSIDGAPLVIKNAVIVTTSGGHIIAIGTDDPQ
ncbi:MAG: PQQ-like beta-propeller repeat protein [Acidimicrobiia bacterium]|nr:PQQ-like beta-propeller repeat protein [Acidimicrobiia bacterium]